jgi:hypothetical protein
MASHDESTTLELQAATTDRPSLTSHRAADKALSTNELLCGIISHLPFNDIVAATRVCRIWRDTLVADPNIQETLFLRPTEIREVIPIDHVELPDAPVPIEDCSIIGNLNPWLFKICGPVRTAGLYPGGDDDIRPGSTRPELSCDGLWRQMFVTQPPCKKHYRKLLVQSLRRTILYLGTNPEFQAAKRHQDGRALRLHQRGHVKPPHRCEVLPP